MSAKEDGAEPHQEMPDTTSGVWHALSQDVTRVRENAAALSQRVASIEDIAESIKNRNEVMHAQFSNHMAETHSWRSRFEEMLKTTEKTLLLLPEQVAERVGLAHGRLESRMTAHESLDGHPVTVSKLAEMGPAFHAVRAGRKWFMGAVAVSATALFLAFAVFAVNAIVRAAIVEARQTHPVSKE